VAAVEFSGVTKHYRRGRGIEGVSLRVEPGQVVGLLGPNGAGKTTTLRLLVDLIRPQAGRITVHGLDSHRDAVAVHRRLGYLPGELSLYERMTARALLTHFAHLRDGGTWAMAAPWVERLGLEPDVAIRTLSKGNKQKVGLVQALMGEPDLLVLDEPTSGLDPLMQREVLAIVREAAQGGRAVLLSSHVLSEVARSADLVVLLRDGRVVATEPVTGVRAAHVVEGRLAAPPVPGTLASIEGLTVDGDRFAGTVSGPLEGLLQALAVNRVAELTVREPDLEDLFLGRYRRAGDAD
jgi:ABC-2 type transport system ATP-binding protein